MRMRLPQIWRLEEQNYRLVGEECQRCGSKLFPPRDVCPECNKSPYHENSEGTAATTVPEVFLNYFRGGKERGG
jgi:uncharacterized OB-fold protein